MKNEAGYAFHATTWNLGAGKWSAIVLFERWEDFSQQNGKMVRHTLPDIYPSQAEALAAGERYGKERVNSGDVEF